MRLLRDIQSGRQQLTAEDGTVVGTSEGAGGTVMVSRRLNVRNERGPSILEATFERRHLPHSSCPTAATGTPASEIERAEIAIVDHLKARLGASVKIEPQPDDPERFDFAGASSAVLVHFAQSTPSGASSGNRVKLAGMVGFAVIVLSRSLRGQGGGYRLLETVEQALAGADIAGLREIHVKRSRLDMQAGGTWRWVVEVETELMRGRVPSFAQPFVSGFEERTS